MNVTRDRQTPRLRWQWTQRLHQGAQTQKVLLKTGLQPRQERETRTIQMMIRNLWWYYLWLYVLFWHIVLSFLAGPIELQWLVAAIPQFAIALCSMELFLHAHLMSLIEYFICCIRLWTSVSEQYRDWPAHRYLCTSFIVTDYEMCNSFMNNGKVAGIYYLQKVILYMFTC